MKLIIANQNGHLFATQVDESFNEDLGTDRVLLDVSDEDAKYILKATSDYLAFQLKLGKMAIDAVESKKASELV